MTIRITTITEPDGTVFKVDGRLQRGDLDELAQILMEWDRPVALDLTQLLSVDRSAAALLREMVAMGVEIRSASPYLQLLIDSGPEARREPAQEDP